MRLYDNIQETNCLPDSSCVREPEDRFTSELALPFPDGVFVLHCDSFKLSLAFCFSNILSSDILLYFSKWWSQKNDWNFLCCYFCWNYSLQNLIGRNLFDSTWLDKKKTTKHSKIRARNAMLHFSPCTPSYMFIFKLIIERRIIKSGGETKTNLFAEVTSISYQLKVASSWNGE